MTLSKKIDSPDLARVLEARSHDPFGVLGAHDIGGGKSVIRVLRPHTAELHIPELGADLERVPNSDLFEWRGPSATVPERYRLQWKSTDGYEGEAYDPYCFPPLLHDSDLDAFYEGHHTRAQRFLGSHLAQVDDIAGVRFAVWAPNAERVSVIGNFNRWDGRCHPMRNRGRSGIWEIFIPGLDAGEFYKYEIRNRDTGAILKKIDPFGRYFEHRPATATVMIAHSEHEWKDGDWMQSRAEHPWLDAAISIYEVHLGSWRRGPDGNINYRDIAEPLADYVAECGFTHVELMPLTEFPLDQSWGYQPTGYFAPTCRFGQPDDLRYFIDQMHQRGIGVILDWVPGHFPRDAHGLAKFDGGPLFEYGDVQKGEHSEWGTLIFDYDRNEVRSFLISSALFWLEEFHMDGLRVDAVASMLYLDYSRKHGEWSPNIHGGNENLEAIAFLKQMNEVTHNECPGSITIAEESTAFPGVSRPTYTGGLGFSFKWNMGWMHDSLQYFSKDPIYRPHHHNQMTFGPVYAFSENFVLPFSHDEVVHQKGSILGRMPGDDWQRFANLRLLYTWHWTFPGKKLLFMGSEFGQPGEWDHSGELPWHLLDQAPHAGVRRLVSDLNRTYRDELALHHYDHEAQGFEWLRWDDSANSILSYVRRSGDQTVIIVLNMTPVPRLGYRVGVPSPGNWREILNSDSRFYGGSDLGNPIPIGSQPHPAMHRDHSIQVTLPPLAAIVLKPVD